MEICIRHGIKVYPVYQHRDQYRGKKLIYEKDNWYIEVDNNGKITKYTKPVAQGKVVRGKALVEPVEKTYSHWAEKLNEIKR